MTMRKTVIMISILVVIVIVIFLLLRTKCTVTSADPVIPEEKVESSDNSFGVVIEDMDGRVDVILDGGPVQVGVESTSDCTAKTPPTASSRPVERRWSFSVSGSTGCAPQSIFVLSVQ